MSSCLVRAWCAFSGQDLGELGSRLYTVITWLSADGWYNTNLRPRPSILHSVIGGNSLSLPILTSCKESSCKGEKID